MRKTVTVFLGAVRSGDRTRSARVAAPIGRTTLLLMMWILWVIGLAVAHAGPNTMVRTHQGTVVGVDAGGGLRVFRGIPYAKPPVGELRWRPPQPPERWRGTRQADQFGPRCPQLDRRPDLADTHIQSEDCLYLNIWTPPNTSGKPLPVMVWVHGGAYVAGSGARYDDWTDGATLARQGVVLVTLNYRLGILGFLAHPELNAESPLATSGNYAFMDVIAALEWLRGNIERFGGDPRNITLFGQSAGSEIVTILMTSPRARGLFARGICQSGGSLGAHEPKSLAVAAREGQAFAARIGATSLKDLRAIPARELLLAAESTKFEAAVEPAVYPLSLREFLRRKLPLRVQLIVGSTADEAALHEDLTTHARKEEARRRFGDLADRFLAQFPARNEQDVPWAAKRAAVAEADYIASAVALNARQPNGPAVYQYRFEHAPPPSPYGYSGAYHGAEVAYVFRALDSLGRDYTATDRRLESLISAYWINFARTGDPNGGDLPRWRSIAEDPTRVLVIADEPHMAPRADPELMHFLEDFYYGPQGLYRPTMAPSR